MEGLTCSQECSLLSTTNEAVSLQDAHFSSITIPDQSHLLDLSTSSTRDSLLSNVSFSNVNVSGSSSLISINYLTSSSNFELAEIFLKDSTLPRALVEVTGDSDLNSLNFKASRIEFHSSSVGTIVKADSLSSLTLADCAWEATSRSELFENLV